MARTPKCCRSRTNAAPSDPVLVHWESPSRRAPGRPRRQATDSDSRQPGNTNGPRNARTMLLDASPAMTSLVLKHDKGGIAVLIPDGSKGTNRNQSDQ